MTQGRTRCLNNNGKKTQRGCHSTTSEKFPGRHNNGYPSWKLSVRSTSHNVLLPLIHWQSPDQPHPDVVQQQLYNWQKGPAESHQNHTGNNKHLPDWNNIFTSWCLQKATNIVKDSYHHLCEFPPSGIRTHCVLEHYLQKAARKSLKQRYLHSFAFISKSFGTSTWKWFYFMSCPIYFYVEL